jgi:hypothetical protein
MSELSRRQISEILPKIKSDFERMVKTNDLAGFKRILGNYAAGMDSETKEELIRKFKQLATAWYESQKKSSR